MHRYRSSICLNLPRERIDCLTVPQDRNVVLSVTYEYRQPSQQTLAEASAAAESANSKTVKADMISRYLGLVVIPGEHIVKMEVEEFSSQVRSRSIWERRDIYGTAGAR
jgi:hypothetical protein